MLVTTTTSEHIGHWIKMRRSLARFSALESSVRTRYSADFIITTPGSRFSVHTTHGYHLAAAHAYRARAEYLREDAYGDVRVAAFRSVVSTEVINLAATSSRVVSQNDG